PMMNGWSPGRLSLAGPPPALFSIPPGTPRLTPPETPAVTEGSRLIAALGGLHYSGLGRACVAGRTAPEVARGLEAIRADNEEAAAIAADPLTHRDDRQALVGVTEVPGGCIVTQPWGPLPSTP